MSTLLPADVFFLFAGVHHYPSGGVHDFIGFFSDYDRALLKATNYNNRYGWWHITTPELRIVMSSYEYQRGDKV